jgi:hypothetical protein
MAKAHIVIFSGKQHAIKESTLEKVRILRGDPAAPSVFNAVISASRGDIRGLPLDIQSEIILTCQLQNIAPPGIHSPNITIFTPEQIAHLKIILDQPSVEVSVTTAPTPHKGQGASRAS